MSYEYGRSVGSSLGDRTEALESIRRRTLSEWQNELAAKRERLEPKILASQRQARRVEQIERGTDRLRLEKQRLEEARDRSTGDFSTVKGVLYLVLSITLILADLSLLGRVTAVFLDQPWYSGGRSFPQTLFGNPAEALLEFPDLFLLVLSVLLLGFFLKVWRDVEDGTQTQGPQRRRDRILFTTLLVLALVSVVLMSTARLTMKFGEEAGTTLMNAEYTWPGFVSFVLGFSLPLVSAGFFLRGYEILERRYQLFRLSLRLWANELHLQRVHNRKDRLLGQILSCREKIEALEDEDRLEEGLEEKVRQFEQGYAKGVAELIGPGDLVNRLKPLLVERAMRNLPRKESA